MKLKLKLRDGTETEIEVSDEQLLTLAQASLKGIRRRSSIVECSVCGERCLVNNQDFKLVIHCDSHRKSG